MDAGELEGWTLRFLASLADKPSWENTVSLVNDHHQTLAHLAILFRYTTLLKKVTQWGIDVDVQDVNGFTALHCAYLCGDLDSVGILTGCGADEDIQDSLGRRPLDMYISRTNDLGNDAPLSDRTSSSAQGPTSGDEIVSMTSQQGGFSNHEATMDLPASRHQPLHTLGSTTSSSVIPASVSMPSPADSNSFLTDNEEWIKGLGGLSLSDPSVSLEHTPPSSHVPDISVAMFPCAHHPVNPQRSPYQGYIPYPPGPYETDSATTLPPQLTTSSPSVFYGPVDQKQGTRITAEVSASQCLTPPQALGLPSSPVLSMNQALGLTPYRQADNGPRRILAVPVQSIPITDPSIYAVVAAFQIAPWMRHQVEEPGPAGKSCYFQLIDEPTMACRLCGKHERRVERLVSHLRQHFDHRPYPCKGQCGVTDW